MGSYQERAGYSKCHVNSDQLYQGALRIEAKKWMIPDDLTGYFIFNDIASNNTQY